MMQHIKKYIFDLLLNINEKTLKMELSHFKIS